MKDLVRAALDGDTSAVARLLSISESGSAESLELHEALFPLGGKARIIGITGPAGAGKSTLIGRLAVMLAPASGKTAVIACDPSSPASGGALLGDRIRMQALEAEARVFIRSLATRHSGGGLPLAAFRAADLFDACGFETIIVETVGTGQNQLDIMQAAHTIVAVSSPGLGDEIQAMKSGLLEVAHIHAVTKSDLAGAEKTLHDIRNAVHLRRGEDDGPGYWAAPVLPVSGLSGEGVDALRSALQAHQEFLGQQDHMEQRCRQMLQARIRREAAEQLERSLAAAPGERTNDVMEAVLQRRATPAHAARAMLGKLGF